MSARKLVSILFALALITGLLAACASPTPTVAPATAVPAATTAPATAAPAATAVPATAVPATAAPVQPTATNCSRHCTRYPFLPG